MDLVVDKEEGMHGFGSPELREFISIEGSIFTPPTCILREYITRNCSSIAAQMFILVSRFAMIMLLRRSSRVFSE